MDVFPQPKIEPRPLHWECKVLTTGPPGKSLLSSFLIYPFLHGATRNMAAMVAVLNSEDKAVIGSKHFPEHTGRRQSLLNDIADNMSAFKMHSDIP